MRHPDFLSMIVRHLRSMSSTGVRFSKCARCLSPLVLGLLVMLFTTPGLNAAERSIRIQWSPVTGARGYAVEWEGLNAPSELKGGTSVQSTEVELRLNPGDYQIRVSALNRFGKPAGFSDWIHFKIEDIARTQTLDLNKAEEAQKKETVEPQPQLPPFSWKPYVPGLLQIQSGHRYGWLYPAGITGFVYYAYNAKQKGDLLAANRWNNPNFFVPLYGGLSFETKMLLWQRRNEQRKTYDAYQQDQRRAAYGILLLLAAHAVEVYRWDFHDRSSAVLLGPDGASVQVQF